MRRNLLLLFVLLLVGGCGRPTQLERTVSSLKAGMSKDEVKLAITGFPIALETNEVGKIKNEQSNDHWRIWLDNTNGEYASCIQFGPKHFGLMECGFVYFDTNNIIVAHQYELMD